MRGARAHADVHAHTQVAKVLKTSERLILNDTPLTVYCLVEIKGKGLDTFHAHRHFAIKSKKPYPDRVILF